MTMHATRDGSGALRIRVEGSLTIYEAAQLKASLLDALTATTALELDLGAVDEADTAGLQLLLLARREAARAGRPLRLASLSPALAEAIACYGLQGAFVVADQTAATPSAPKETP